MTMTPRITWKAGDAETQQRERAQFYRECARDQMTIERWTVEDARAKLRRCRCAPVAEEKED